MRSMTGLCRCGGQAYTYKGYNTNRPLQITRQSSLSRISNKVSVFQKFPRFNTAQVLPVTQNQSGPPSANDHGLWLISVILRQQQLHSNGATYKVYRSELETAVTGETLHVRHTVDNATSHPSCFLHVTVKYQSFPCTCHLQSLQIRNMSQQLNNSLESLAHPCKFWTRSKEKSSLQMRNLKKE